LLTGVHGFDVDALAGVVRAGFASIAPESMRAGGRKRTLVRMRITDAERQALAA
jgi:hypothetical protein